MLRSEELSVAGVTLPLPNFFPAISSVKTRLRPLAYLRVLVGLEYPLFLISAYDIYHSKPKQAAMIRRLMRKATRQKRIVLMDSGNYEAFWHGKTKSKTKRWSARKMLSVLGGTAFNLAFSFDNLTPPGKRLSNVRQIEAAVLKGQRVAGNGTVVPIVHGRTSQLPHLAREVAKRLTPILVGVPERELGDGLIERAETISNIRKELNQLGDKYCNLHILGTGNPLSILVYALCGADTFDGLEWCQTAADAGTGRLYHFSQWGFFESQCGWDLSALPYATRVLIHNLWFYKEWVDRVRWAVRARQGLELLDERLPRKVAEQVRAIVPKDEP